MTTPLLVNGGVETGALAPWGSWGGGGATLTAACTAALEDAIRRNPVEWVWMHERWKTRPPAETAGPAT